METLTDSTIKDFAAAVRAELKDLPKATIDELTGDLEASLAERQADEGDAFELGSPEIFAAELREAAGVSQKPNRLSVVNPKVIVSRIEALFRKFAVTNSLLEFGISIRPLWWVLRAFIAWNFIWGYREYLNTSTSWIILLGLTFLSVQWGRKKWFTNKFFSFILVPLNLLAILLLPLTGILTENRISYVDAVQETLMNIPASNGLRLDGNPVTEITAVDASGQKIEGLTFLNPDGIDLLNPSYGEQIVVIPELRGKTLAEAQAILNPLGIQNVDITQLDDGNTADSYVQYTNPTAGDQFGTTSTLTIFLGKTK